MAKALGDCGDFKRPNLSGQRHPRSEAQLPREEQHTRWVQNSVKGFLPGGSPSDPVAPDACEPVAAAGLRPW